MHGSRETTNMFPVAKLTSHRAVALRYFGVMFLFWCTPNSELLGQRPAELSEITGKQFRVDQIDQTARRQVAQARELLNVGRTDDAINLYRRLIDEHGTKLIQLDTESTGQAKEYVRYVTLREFCHMRICSLDPDQLSLYRRRVDPVAKQLYRQGRDNLDAGLLRRVVDDYFASSSGDDAMYALGELALERGDYSRARHYWERIDSTLRSPVGFPVAHAVHGINGWQDMPTVIVQWLTSVPQRRSWLVYPNTDLDVAMVRARLVLASIRERSAGRATIELELLRRMSPGAQGTINGQAVELAVELASVLDDSKSWPASPRPEAISTFAGRTFHEGIRAQELDIVPRPVWSRELGIPPAVGRLEMDDGSYGQRRYGSDLYRVLSYYPIMVGHIILVHDGNHIWAFDRTSGDAAFPGRENRAKDHAWGLINKHAFVVTPPNESSVRSWWVPRFTMTAVGKDVFARMGDPFLAVAESGRTGASRLGGSYLVGLNLEKQGKLIGDLIHEQAEGFRFEGTPVSDGRLLYVAQRRDEAMGSQFYVSAFEPKTGREQWRQWVVSAGMLGNGKVRGVANNLLSMSEDTIFVNTNLGAVAAMDARSGTIRWLTSYPRILHGNVDDPPVQVYRGSDPCLVYKDLIIVAPHDCRQLFALDRMTGQLVWETDVPRDLMYQLGVVNDRLVVSGDSIWWLNVYNGTTIRRFPVQGAVESLRSGPMPRGLGRGLITEHSIWWPTEEGIYLFDVRSMQHIDTIRLSSEDAKVEIGGGNLLIADDYLLVTTSDHIHAYNRYGPLRKF